MVAPDLAAPAGCPHPTVVQCCFVLERLLAVRVRLAVLLQTMQARQLAPHAHAFNALINATGRAFRLGDVAGLVRLLPCLLELVLGLAPCKSQRHSESLMSV